MMHRLVLLALLGLAAGQLDCEGEMEAFHECMRSQKGDHHAQIGACFVDK